MKWIVYLLLLCPVVAFTQTRDSTTRDLSTQAQLRDQSREAMFNTARDPNAALTAGGAFYVSNPTPLYEVDAEKAYLDPAFEPLTIILQSGEEYDLPGRIRLVDQKIEVEVEGEIYDLDNQVLKAVITPQDRVYISAFDPVGRIKGAQIYEVVFAHEDRRLLVNQSTMWEDPPQQNMFDTREVHRTLKRITRVYLVDGSRSTEINRLSDLLDALGLDRSSRAGQYARREGLKNEAADYVALLNFVNR